MLISSSTFAAELPDTLKYHGKPIEPLCFKDTMISGPEPDLKACNDPKLKESVEIIPEEASKDGSIGYSFKYRDEDRYPYVYYRYIGSHEGRDVILLNVSGGGTGQFSFVLGLKRKGDKLIADKDYASGDRCNGGINDVTIADGKVIIDESVTLSDLYGLAEIQPPDGLKPSAILDGSPRGCFGQVQKEDGKFITYTPTKELYYSNSYNDTSKGTLSKEVTYQDCLMDLYKDMPLEQSWTPAQMKEFMTRFNQTCFKNK